MARKIRQVNRRLTRQSVARSPFPVESFLPTRYCGSGETTIALMNALLAGANGQLLSDSVRSARNGLNKKNSSLSTGENSQQVVVSPPTVVTDSHRTKIV